MCTAIEQHPGKFEGEPCMTKLVDAWDLEGFADEPMDMENDEPSVFYGPFSTRDIWAFDVPICNDCIDMIIHANEIKLFQSNDGFLRVAVA